MSSKSQQELTLPIPISLVAGRYLLFDIDAAIYLRREHNICGYNIGTLAQIPSQNAFLGLPVILMPEEAQVLVDQGVGYVFDDTTAHKQALYGRDPNRVARYRSQMTVHADAVRAARVKDQEDNKKRFAHRKSAPKKAERSVTAADSLFDEHDATSDVPEDTPSSQHFLPASMQSHHITPTSSAPLLDFKAHNLSKQKQTVPNLPKNYPLFRHLHSRGYFMTPGLRFGCQYTTYPGDPLRFHSHFLTADFGWDESINLMDIVGGGRLGTGVKKGFLIGSQDTDAKHEKGADDPPKVRTFSVEWAVM